MLQHPEPGAASSLAEYQSKRRFDRTPEPGPLLRPGRGPLHFVVQKHRASRLHFDFRLELNGVMKSWAVPKGPTLDPAEKRLAVLVEDHPLDYRTFEGVIPAGNYGAGPVMIWDLGTFHVKQTCNREESERLATAAFEAGDLKIILHGRRLHGEFALVRLKKGEPNSWLLIKKQDRWAAPSETSGEDRSMVTGRTMDEIAAGRPTVHTPEELRLLARGIDLSDAPAGRLPRDVKPMLAQPARQPFDRPGWLFEIKWDGYRAIAEVEHGRVRLYSRRNLTYEGRYTLINDSLQHLGHDAVLDGEIVVLDPAGRARFQLLQNYLQGPGGTLAYYVFDLLHLDGRDLRGLALGRRRQVLQKLLPPDLPHVRLSEHIEERGITFFRAAEQRGLEGIIAKDGRSLYQGGRRTTAWLKIKTRLRQEFVIGGYTAPRGAREKIGALIVGVYEGDRLEYAGRVGTGFNDASLSDLFNRLSPLAQALCPFSIRPKTETTAHWVRPELVCEATFLNWTSSGQIREPVYQGLRVDKDPREVRREQEREVETREPDLPRPAARPAAGRQGPKNQNLLVAGRLVPVTNLTKVFWPEEGYTKGDLVDYYRAVAPFILPHLRDRPQSLNRHPNGIEGKSFFQKDIGRQAPDWVQTVRVSSESSDKETTFLLCQDEATLVYMANLACIELNPWMSRVAALSQPDYLAIDLDPEDISFDEVVEAATALRKVLDKAGAACVCKTSGKRGLHIYVPLGAKYSYDQGRQFAQIVAQIVHSKLPQITSLVRMPAQRQQRVYLDCLQNRRGQTLAAVYSVRPVPGALVSTPLKWSEVRRGLDPTRFTIRTVLKRLDKEGDLFGAALGTGIDIVRCLDRLQALAARGTLQ